MPTWINHFRVVDKLLPNIKNMDMEAFLIGTIAPDCGVAGDRPGVYLPPSGVTHFTKDMYYSEKTDCDYSLVYEKYVKDETDLRKRSFYMAYFIHLYIDCAFANDVFAPIREMCDDFYNDFAFRDTVRAERHNIDMQFLAESVSQSYELFKKCKPWRESYPQWYENNEIKRQMKNIIHCYKHPKPKDMEYKYFTPKTMDDFVNNVYLGVIDELKSRNIEL